MPDTLFPELCDPMHSEYNGWAALLAVIDDVQLLGHQSPSPTSMTRSEWLGEVLVHSPDGTHVVRWERRSGKGGKNRMGKSRMEDLVAEFHKRTPDK